MFGTLRSSGLWGALGDFVIGGVLCSIFAYPKVLYNNESIDSKAFWWVIASSVLIVLVVLLNLARLHSSTA